MPDETEWNDLLSAVGGKDVAGTKLKSASGWEMNGNGDDTFGFSALPAGYKQAPECPPPAGSSASHVSYCLYDWDYFGYDYAASFGCSTEHDSEETYYLFLSMHDGYAQLRSDVKLFGFSVRCIKD